MLLSRLMGLVTEENCKIYFYHKTEPSGKFPELCEFIPPHNEDIFDTPI